MKNIFYISNKVKIIFLVVILFCSALLAQNAFAEGDGGGGAGADTSVISGVSNFNAQSISGGGTFSAETRLKTPGIVDYTGMCSIYNQIKTVLQGESTNPFIVVLTPNGGETVQKGSFVFTRPALSSVNNLYLTGYVAGSGTSPISRASSASITWQSVGLSGESYVNIDLYKGGTLFQNIASQVPNNGSLNVTIPKTGIPVGTDYKIRITSSSSPSVYDESDSNFTIADNPSILDISSPIAGETWNSGTVHKITWSLKNKISDEDMAKLNKFIVSGYLYKQGTSLCQTQLFKDVKFSEGSYSWAVPPFSTGGDYQLVVLAQPDKRFECPTDGGCKYLLTGGWSYRTSGYMPVNVKTAKDLEEATTLSDPSIVKNLVAYSENFIIYTPPKEPLVLTIVSPSGGESWLPGTTHNVTWHTPSNLETGSSMNDATLVSLGPGYFKIDLYNISQGKTTLVSSLKKYGTDSQGRLVSGGITVEPTTPPSAEYDKGYNWTFSWKIPASGIPEGGQYRIKVEKVPISGYANSIDYVSYSNEFSIGTGSSFATPKTTTTVANTTTENNSLTTTTTETSVPQTTPACDSTSYNSQDIALDLTSIGTKSGMCGAPQYYKVSIPKDQTCDLNWTVQSDSNSDYDLYANWKDGELTRNIFSGRSVNGKAQKDELTQNNLSFGNYYALVYRETKDVNSGTYSIVSTLSNCVAVATQQELTQQTGSNSDFCYTFTKILRYKDTGYAVGALQAILKKEGLLNIAKLTTYFGEATRQAVIAFQEKYKDEILTPYNLTNGTGIVGNATIKKLNELYGCR